MSLLAATWLATCAPAHAQQLSAGVEAATDESRRGLSWSGGRAVAAANASGSFGAVEASTRIVTTRGSARHAGADAAIDLAAGTGWDVGPLRLSGRVIGHLFTGARADLDFVELGAVASYSLGPLQVDAGANYAPDQRAIGGDNLYLFAEANAGIPATPFTVTGAIGRSSGSTDEPVRAARLRPAGSYTDWRIGIEHVTGTLTLGIDYVGTDVERYAALSPYADARHSGDRLIGRVRLSF